MGHAGCINDVNNVRNLIERFGIEKLMRGERIEAHVHTEGSQPRVEVAQRLAEFFLAIPGVGYFILYNSRTFHHADAFVGVLLLAAFGVGIEVAVNAATRRFLPWYRRGEG